MNKAASIAVLLGALSAPLATTSYAVPLAVTETVTHEELNLAQIEERLRETKAISGLKKLSLKGQIDDLLGRIRQAHATGGRPEVAKLRAPFNALIDKTYALLTKDPALGRDILASREKIWDVLEDRTQFALLN